jgi:hypothetical protein
MNPGIFLIQNNEELVEMNEQQYDSEKLLQSWLAKYPALLVGNQIDAKEPRRWLFIEQECGVPSEEGGAGRWAIDHLFIDQDAIPTIVEVKRSSDTRIRREVVGQMLDYAANAVAHWPVAHMRERFAANCEGAGVDPEERLREFLEEDIEPEEFWQMANKNLERRNIRLLFVADVIPKELQRIVEFLNEQMKETEVLAIEIKQFVSEQGLRSLVPRVIGQTAKAGDTKAGGSRKPKKDEVSFFEAMETNASSPAEIEVARKLLEWSKENFSELNWGRTSFSPVLDCGRNASHNPLTIYTSGKRGLNAKLRVRFRRMMRVNPPFESDEKRMELLRRLNEVPGINLPPASIREAPTIPLAALADQRVFDLFTKIIEWTNEEVSCGQTAVAKPEK